MEIVSQLCFGGPNVPQPELIKFLIDTIFTERPENERGSVEEGVGTRELTYADSKGDDVPVIRSFLLQLLLEHK